jgi:hypothetical protein
MKAQLKISLTWVFDAAAIPNGCCFPICDRRQTQPETICDVIRSSDIQTHPDVVLECMNGQIPDQFSLSNETKSEIDDTRAQCVAHTFAQLHSRVVRGQKGPHVILGCHSRGTIDTDFGLASRLKRPRQLPDPGSASS